MKEQRIRKILPVINSILKWSGIIILVIISIYWCFQAFMKYLSEPVITNIQFQNGDNEKENFTAQQICLNDKLQQDRRGHVGFSARVERTILPLRVPILILWLECEA